MAILDIFSLKNKVALVTGGDGLYGRQIVRALAEAGATTYSASIAYDASKELAAELCAEGLDVRALFLDQSDESSIFAVRDAIVKESCSLHILINNAVARTVKKGYFDDVEAINDSLRINGTGLIILTRALGEVIADGGSIINIGSMMGLVGVEPLNYKGTDMNGWFPDYFYNKGGMANYTRFLASYYGSRQIRVNCVHPGGLQHPSHPEAFIKNYSERTCLGRMAGQNDLMGVMVFLASDASTYITGANIPVDGGYTAK